MVAGQIPVQMLGPEGSLVDDFLVLEGARVVSVCNTVPPAATALLRIGALIVEGAGFRIQWRALWR
jgi:hypothetical protein